MSATPRTPEAKSPLEALGAELGAIAAQIDRETRLRLDAGLADLKRHAAEMDLRFERLEREVTERVAAIERDHPRQKPRVKVPAGSSPA